MFKKYNYIMAKMMTENSKYKKSFQSNYNGMTMQKHVKVKFKRLKIYFMADRKMIKLKYK